MKMQTIILMLATLSTGIMAGIFFTWSNAVTPGIGKLNDMGYLSAFQSMNRVILNPTFKGIFLGTTVLVPLALAVNYKTDPPFVVWLLLGAAILYLVGATGVTFLGNIPLNNLLDQTNLDQINGAEAKSLRATIEGKWNFLNWIRTWSSCLSFLLLLMTCLLAIKN